MNADEVFARVRDIIEGIRVETTPVDPNSIQLSTSLRDGELALDSIDFVKMVVALEGAFGFIAEDEDFLVSSVETVADVVKLVSARRAAST